MATLTETGLALHVGNLIFRINVIVIALSTVFYGGGKVMNNNNNSSSNNKYKLIVLDYDMAGMNGIECGIK